MGTRSVQNNAAAAKEIEFVFYETHIPHQVAASDSNAARWEKLTGRITTQEPTRILLAEELVGPMPFPKTDGALEAASLYASRLSLEKSRRCRQSLVLLSLCTVLYHSGQAPDEIDTIIRTIAKSSNAKYLDTLKRGARIANEIIAKWAERSGGDQLQRLGQATQMVLQGVLLVRDDFSNTQFLITFSSALYVSVGDIKRTQVPSLGSYSSSTTARPPTYRLASVAAPGTHRIYHEQSFGVRASLLPL